MKKIDIKKILTKGILPGILRIKDKRVLGVVNVWKSFSIFGVVSAGLGAQNNFEPLLLMVCRTAPLFFLRLPSCALKIFFFAYPALPLSFFSLTLLCTSKFFFCTYPAVPL